MAFFRTILFIILSIAGAFLCSLLSNQDFSLDLVIMCMIINVVYFYNKEKYLDE